MNYRLLAFRFLLVLATISLASFVSANEQQYQINLPAQTVAESLNSLSQQADIPVFFPYRLAQARIANPIAGQYTLQQAVAILLNGTGLYGGLSDKGVLMISNMKSDTKNQGREAMKQTNKKVLAALIGAFAAGGSSGIMAQGEEGATSQARLDEIIVTSLKREQNIQDAAVSVMVLDSETITARGLVSMDDYLRMTAGVSHLEMGAGHSFTVIRGLSSNPQGEGFSAGQTVGTYFGEIPLSGLRHFNTDVKLVDMERVEVLRGPQGTLYGSGSMAGTVRNIPVVPNLDQIEGSVKVGYSNTDEGGDNNMLQGVVNIPIVDDKFAIRAVAYEFENSGYIKNIAASDDDFFSLISTFGQESLAIDQDGVGSDDYVGGRLTALWVPNDKLRATLTYLTQDLDQDGSPEVNLDLGKYEQVRMQFPEIAGGGGQFRSDELDITNLVLEYDLDWGSLLSSSSLSEQISRRHTDLAYAVGGASLPQLISNDDESFSQEIRVASELDGPWQFLAGYYYEEITKSRYHYDIFYGGDPAFNPFSSILVADFSVGHDLEQSTFFGELSYDLTDQVSITAGLRRFSYDRTTTTTRAGGAVYNNTFSEVVLSTKQSDTSYKVNISYAPNDDATLYAQWSQGFRLGRAQSPLPPVLCDIDDDGIIDGTDVKNSNLDVDSDYLDNFELGGKFTFNDGRLVINAAVYQGEWAGLPIVNFNTDCDIGFVANAGEALTRGVEFETSFFVTDNLQVSVSASHVNAELSKDAPSLGGLDGDRLPGSPENNASVGMQYNTLVAGSDAYIRGDYAYVGGFYNNLKELGFEAGDYQQLNIRAGVTMDKISLEFFINNLTDADELTWVSSDGGGSVHGNRLRPRTVGLNVGYHF